MVIKACARKQQILYLSGYGSQYAGSDQKGHDHHADRQEPEDFYAGFLPEDHQQKRRNKGEKVGDPGIKDQAFPAVLTDPALFKKGDDLHNYDYKIQYSCHIHTPHVNLLQIGAFFNYIIKKNYVQ